MDFYREALNIKDEIVAHRRFMHKNAESGGCTPITADYILNTLKNYGIPSQLCGNGVTATVGSGSPVILLRADMDALPMAEQSGETFSSATKSAHTCGHDMHAAMLLGAAKLLKMQEKQLCGTIRFMFQPGEEILSGCRSMIKNGILQNPAPQAAFALHTAAGGMLPGTFMYNADEALMLSADNFEIAIKGKGGHGAYPDLAVDPINAAVHIYTALQSLAGREIAADKICIVTMGQFIAGESGNIIPDDAVIKGALRTDDESVRSFAKKRIEEIVQFTAQCFGASAAVSWTGGAPALNCDGGLVNEMTGYIKELPIPDAKFIGNMQAAASEDFAYIAQKIPSAYIYISAGFDDERGKYTAHNPRVCFNEDALPVGAAVYAHCASRWLTENYGR